VARADALQTVVHGSRPHEPRAEPHRCRHRAVPRAGALRRSRIGAHLLGPHADEVINLFALAMRARLPASDLKEAIFAYPTSGSDVSYML